MALIFGSSTASFNHFGSGSVDRSEFQHTVNHQVLYFVYLFIGRFVVGYIGTLCICVAAARTTNALRKAFLESLLRQQISHFDTNENGSVAAQVTTNGSRINAGIAEKLYNFFQGISLFFSAFIVALAKQPVLAIITMSIVPGIVLAVASSLVLDAPIETRIVSCESTSPLSQERHTLTTGRLAFTPMPQVSHRMLWVLSRLCLPLERSRKLSISTKTN